MAIFTRRDIQAMLDRAVAYMANADLREKVSALNCVGRPNEDARATARRALQTEWELAIADAASQCGTVIFEKKVGAGTAKPDVLFRSADDQNDHEFVFDITAISDKAADQFNQDCDRELRVIAERLVQLGMREAKVVLEFGTVVLPSGKYVPGLPKNDEEREWLVESLRKVCEEFALGSAELQVEIRRDHIRLYVKRSNVPSISWTNNTVYSQPNSLTANPLYNALTAKSNQLLRSGYDGIKGVIVCDGGCDAIRQLWGWQNRHSTSEITKFAQRRFPALDFVVALETKWEISRIPDVNRKIVIPQYFFRDTAVEQAIRRDLEAIVSALPTPVWDAVNAVHRLEVKKDLPGSSCYGDSQGDERSIRISARALIRVLAGELDFQTFMRDHRFVENPQFPTKSAHNAFAYFLRENRCLSAMRVEQDGDDEWLEFEFSSTPDPAVSKFRDPTAK